MSKPVLAKDIIKFLRNEVKNIYGNPEGIVVNYLRNPQKADQYTLDWISVNQADKQIIAEKSKALVIIADSDIAYSDKLKAQEKVILVVDNPKLAIAKIGNEFFIEKFKAEIHPSANIHPGAKLGKNLYIGPNVVVGKCTIEDNTIIMGNSYIYDNVIIHKNVEIHNGCSIGSEAHNFIKDNYGKMERFPHLGRLIIDEDVIIGSNTVISRGVLNDTIIKKGTKIAQLVFIGANNTIGENCAIRPNVMTSGSVVIGNNSIIAPSATIREHCKIGENCMIGMGAVVTKDVPSNETWVGNPAKIFIK